LIDYLLIQVTTELPGMTQFK